jgi:hypothetical protein
MQEVLMFAFRESMKYLAGISRNGAAVLLACLFGASVACCQSPGTEKLPKAADVLERYVQVTGGRDALLRHKSITIHGRYQVPAQNLDVETVSYSKDGKLVFQATLPDGKLYLTGYDGQIGWDLDPTGKATLHDGDEAQSAARDADMYYHLHVMKYFRSMEVVDIKEFNGRPCYHLKGENNWGKVNEHFYDKANGLLLGYAFNTAWRGGNGDATETFEDYKDFGGVLMAAKTTSRDGKDLSISLITSVTYDDVPNSAFDLPEPVRKAVTERK